MKAVAESAMREVVGRSNIQPILTGARQNIETAVQDLMQKTLDSTAPASRSSRCSCRRSTRRTQVIDAFRDVQAARADLERAQNEAQTYANRVVPEARGRVAQITQNAEAYREQTVAEAHGQTSRFLKIYDEYKKAPDVTRQRMYLETMERVFGGTDKIILDTGGSGQGRRRRAVPAAQRTHAAAARGGRRPMKLGIVRRRARRRSHRRGHPRLQLAVHRLPDPAGAGGPLGQPVRVITEPGLNFKVPLIDNVISIDKRILDLEVAGAGSHRLRPEAARGRCLRALQDQGSAAVLSDGRLDRRRQLAARRCCSTRRCAACSARRRSPTWFATSVSN